MIRLQKTREASILADIFLTKSRYSLLKINDHFAVSKLSILSELSIQYYQNYRYYVEIELLYIYITLHLLYFTFTVLYFTFTLLYIYFTLQETVYYIIFSYVAGVIFIYSSIICEPCCL